MVNRCRSTGLFLTLLSLLLLTACSGGSPQSQNVGDINQATSVDSEAGKSPSSLNSSLKIMAIGDSITQGDADHQSYRYALWKRLIDKGVAFDFVGSMQNNFKGDPGWPDHKAQGFDRDHEGHWGWRVDEVLAGINGWLNQNAPDIVLIHLGTNDIFQGQDLSSTLNELTELVDRFRAENSEVTLLLAQVIPSKFHNTKLDQLNAGIVQLAKSLSNDESPIYLIDMGAGFDPVADTYDGVHPNASGEEKMSTKWFDALMLLEMFH